MPSGSLAVPMIPTPGRNLVLKNLVGLKVPIASSANGPVFPGAPVIASAGSVIRMTTGTTLCAGVVENVYNEDGSQCEGGYLPASTAGWCDYNDPTVDDRQCLEDGTGGTIEALRIAAGYTYPVYVTLAAPADIVISGTASSQRRIIPKQLLDSSTISNVATNKTVEVGGLADQDENDSTTQLVYNVRYLD